MPRKIAEKLGAERTGTFRLDVLLAESYLRGGGGEKKRFNSVFVIKINKSNKFFLYVTRILGTVYSDSLLRKSFSCLYKGKNYENGY